MHFYSRSKNEETLEVDKVSKTYILIKEENNDRNLYVEKVQKLYRSLQLWKRS